MAAPNQRDLPCPRCRYNLRGLDMPRCPECGLTFGDEQWQSGVLREHIPTHLDRCDVWQPHQVILASLLDLLRATLKPAWACRKLDLHGPMSRAMLALVMGALWTYALCTAGMATAIYLLTGSSPATSLKAAVILWAPMMLAVMWGSAALLFGAIAQHGVIKVNRPTLRAYARVACHWIPAVGLWGVIPFLVGHLGPALLGMIGATVWPRAQLVAVAISILPVVLFREAHGEIRVASMTFRTLLPLFAWALLLMWYEKAMLVTDLMPPLWLIW